MDKEQEGDERVLSDKEKDEGREMKWRLRYEPEIKYSA